MYVRVHTCVYVCDMWLDSAVGKAFPVLTSSRGLLWETILWPMCLLMDRGCVFGKKYSNLGQFISLAHPSCHQYFSPTFLLCVWDIKTLGTIYGIRVDKRGHLIPQHLQRTILSNCCGHTGDSTQYVWIGCMSGARKNLIWAPFYTLAVLSPYKKLLSSSEPQFPFL